MYRICGNQFKKPPPLTSFPNGYRVLYTGKPRLPIGGDTNKLWWNQIYFHLLVLRNGWKT